MHPQKAMAVRSLPLSTNYFVLMGDVCKTPQIETNVLIGCVRLRGTNQLDRKIQIAVLRTRQYGKSYSTVGYAINCHIAQFASETVVYMYKALGSCRQ